MKKLLILLFLLSTSLSASANQVFNIDDYIDLDFSLSDFCYLQPDVQDRDGVYYFPNEEVGITAESVCVFKDAYGQYFSKGKLTKGNFDGKWTFWKENGQKDYESNYKDGKEYGKRTISWHKNGQIKIEGTFKDGKKDGEWTEWHSKVHNKTQQYYNELRKLLREDKLYKKMRKLKEKQHIEIGFKNEDLKKEAQKVIKENFPNLTIVEGSELEFKFILKIPSGAYKKSEGYFKDGKKDGKWTEWNKDGQKQSEENYKDGKLGAESSKWDENGQESQYKDGKLHGIVDRHENGQIKSILYYSDNYWNGSYEGWHDNGITSYKGTFYLKKFDAVSEHTNWDRDGNVESSGQYHIKSFRSNPDKGLDNARKIGTWTYIIDGKEVEVKDEWTYFKEPTLKEGE
jgi:antitoxin component YwqK of YwqJK toxin-antitoxin module